MIIALLGKSGSGKTTIAKAMEKYVKNSFVIDGDELRAELKNYDIGVRGRTTNQKIGYERARRLSDLGFTVFLSMQAPYKYIRDRVLNEYDVQIIVHNLGDNPKDKLGYNKDFNPNYDGIKHNIVLQDFKPELFYKKFFPKVLVPARFQGFHKGHKVVIEEAKRISPNITIGLRVDNGDIINLQKNMELLKNRGYNVVPSPDLDEDWTNWANKYDIYVQGNPDVIKKFEKSNCKLHFVPRYGDVSGTQIREMIHQQYEPLYNVDKDVIDLVKESIRKK